MSCNRSEEVTPLEWPPNSLAPNSHCTNYTVPERRSVEAMRIRPNQVEIVCNRVPGKNSDTQFDETRSQLTCVCEICRESWPSEVSLYPVWTVVQESNPLLRWWIARIPPVIQSRLRRELSLQHDQTAWIVLGNWLNQCSAFRWLTGDGLPCVDSSRHEALLLKSHTDSVFV